MSNQGLSNDKLELLRKQREEAKAKKLAEQEALKKQAEQEQNKENEIKKLKTEKAALEAKQKAKEKADREKKEAEKEKEIKQLKADKQRLEKEKEERDKKEREEKDKQIAELKAEKEELKAEKKRLEQEKQLAKEQSILEKITSKKSSTGETENNKKSAAQNKKYVSNVKIVSDDSVVIDKKVIQDDSEEEDGKVQIGFTMVDKTLVDEARLNQRMGIKERSALYKKVNSIVFYVAIPFMLLWAIMAFGGICTARVGYTSFGNNLYYKVHEQTVSDYKVGNTVTIRGIEASDIEINDVVCFEFTDLTTGEKHLYLVRVSDSSSITSSVQSTYAVVTDIYNEFLDSNYNINPDSLSSISADKYVKFMGKAVGKSVLLGQFLSFSQNIVVFIFLVAIPAIIILTFQFINLSDGIKLYIKQKQVGRAKQPKAKKAEKKDKIKR